MILLPFHRRTFRDGQRHEIRSASGSIGSPGNDMRLASRSSTTSWFWAYSPDNLTAGGTGQQWTRQKTMAQRRAILENAL